MSKVSKEINPAGIKLSKEFETPLYMQLYEQFRKMILTGQLRKGDRLPPSREISKELRVSRIIVSNAYEQLIIEGYLIGKTGSGTFVADKLPDSMLNTNWKQSERNKLIEEKESDHSKIQTYQSSTPEKGSRIEVNMFQIGLPSLDAFPYKSWQQISNKVLKNMRTLHLGYEDTLGYWPLRKAIAAYLRISRAVKCEAGQVIVVTGSQQSVNLISEFILAKDEKVWMEDPGYWGAKISFQNAGAKICPAPVENDGLNIGYAIQKYGPAKLVFVTPSHQFPLGVTLSHNKRTQLLEYAHENKMWILEDDYDSEFRYEGVPLASLQGLDSNGRVIYTGTFSKVLFPGLRLAYIVLPTLEMVEDFKKIKDHRDRQSPILEQAILTKFMEDGYFLRHIRKMRLLYAQRQKILIHLLREQLGEYLSIEAAPSGLHLVCLLSDKINVEKFKQEIAKQKLTVSFISNFTLKHTMPPAIALGYSAFSKYKLETGVEKLLQCFQNSLNE